jgi:hypothetical protein
MKTVNLICFSLLTVFSGLALASASGGPAQVDKLPDYYGAEQTVDCLEGYKCPEQEEKATTTDIRTEITQEQRREIRSEKQFKQQQVSNQTYTRAKAFSAALNFRCENGTSLSQQWAEYYANLAESNEIDLDVVLNVFKRTCDASSSQEFAKKVKNSTSDYNAFQESYGFRCENGTSISKEWAEHISSQTASNVVDLNLHIYRP